jgi:hypothetical protein
VFVIEREGTIEIRPDPLRDEVGDYKFKIKRTGEGWTDVKDMRIKVTPLSSLIDAANMIKDDAILDVSALDIPSQWSIESIKATQEGQLSFELPGDIEVEDGFDELEGKGLIGSGEQNGRRL